MGIEDLKTKGPIVVTGTGGSGTRVMAEVLVKLGGFMGHNHNGKPLDNMDSGFFLTGNTSDMRAHFRFNRREEYTKRKIKLFEKAFFFEPYLLRDWLLIFRILFSFLRPSDFWAVWKRPHRTGESRTATLSKILRIKTNTPVPSDAKFWGFKDPDAVYILKALLEYYPNMKLIHMVRDGRDMALSDQKKPYMFYSSIFDTDKEYSIKNVFKYWTEFNIWVLNFIQKNMKEDRILIVKFEDLCQKPIEEINKIANFLEIDIKEDSPAYTVPKVINSIGRWKTKAYEFDDIDDLALKKFSYQ